MAWPRQPIDAIHGRLTRIEGTDPDAVARLWSPKHTVGRGDDVALVLLYTVTAIHRVVSDSIAHAIQYGNRADTVLF